MLEQLVTSEVEGILMWACLIEGLYVEAVGETTKIWQDSQYRVQD